MWDGMIGFDVFPLVEFLLVSLSLYLIAAKSHSHRRLGPRVTSNVPSSSNPPKQGRTVDTAAPTPLKLPDPFANGMLPSLRQNSEAGRNTGTSPNPKWI